MRWLLVVTHLWFGLLVWSLSPPEVLEVCDGSPMEQS